MLMFRSWCVSFGGHFGRRFPRQLEADVGEFGEEVVGLFCAEGGGARSR